jgi:hypothetical protein
LISVTWKRNRSPRIRFRVYSYTDGLFYALDGIFNHPLLVGAELDICRWLKVIFEAVQGMVAARPMRIRALSLLYFRLGGWSGSLNHRFLEPGVG